MKSKDKNAQEIVEKLLNYTISPYEMVTIAQKESIKFEKTIRKLIVDHNSPYVRLCAAWCIGAIADKKNFSLLKKAYKKEKEKNVRANIVWALFMVNYSQIDLDLFKSFLDDEYFVVSLIALKRIGEMSKIQNKIYFYPTFNKFNNVLLKLEMLRNIRSFKLPQNINVKLKKNLYKTRDHLLKMELLNAIGLTNKKDSVDILIKYYYDNKKAILEDESLAYQYVVSTLLLAQSKPYKTLEEIYSSNNSQLIKWRIIESLASAGGPKCLEVLKKIQKLESDKRLKEQINKFIVTIPITIK